MSQESKFADLKYLYAICLMFQFFVSDPLHVHVQSQTT